MKNMTNDEAVNLFMNTTVQRLAYPRLFKLFVGL